MARRRVDVEKLSAPDIIMSVCTDVLKQYEKRFGYKGELKLELVDDAYVATFKARGQSGVVTYRTTLFSPGDEKYMTKEQIADDYENFCDKVFEKLFEIANNEY